MFLNPVSFRPIKHSSENSYFVSGNLSELVVVAGDGRSTTAALGPSSSESSPTPSSILGEILSFDSLWRGSNLTLFCRSKSSYLRRRSRSSRSGNLLLRWRVTWVAGIHWALALTQLAQGCFLSHLTFLCWQRIHASTRWGFGGWGGRETGSGDIDGSVADMTRSSAKLVSKSDTSTTVRSVK